MSAVIQTGGGRLGPGWFIRSVSVCLLVTPLLATGAGSTDPAQERIRLLIESGFESPSILAGGEPIFASSALPLFYEKRGYRTAWTRKGQLTPMASQLMEAIRGAETEGLDRTDYHLERLANLAADVGKRDADGMGLAVFDLLATDAFLILGAHLVNGRIDPVSLEPEWKAVRREVDLVTLLDTALEKRDVTGALDSLRPTDPGYHRLVHALGQYRRIDAEGGFPSMPGGPSLKPGDSGERVALLRARLESEGFTTAITEVPGYYDDALADVVKSFQRRHGLDDDGVVGVQTLEALNVPAGRRARQIELSLERWRWIPRDLGDRYILINVAAFHMYVVENGAVVLDMKVIVGRTARRTPVFSDIMRYLVLNPSWEVPPTILRQDKLPELRRDPDYASRNKFRVFRLTDGLWRQVDPREIDWQNAPASGFRLRQDPGPNNALGRIKFMFPNPFNVYLHDTPSRELFSRSQRDFSSGCIRIEKPLELAVLLLGEDAAWSIDALTRALDSGQERTVMLPSPIPVHILYWTALVDEDGSVEFRRDLYGRDARLESALERRHRTSTETR